jgi:hypothetical protein
MSKSESEELTKKLGHNHFKATDGWLSQWKCRFGIKFKKVHGERDSADGVSGEQWKSTTLPDLLKKFCADDIYNVDETGLFYPAMPNGSLSYRHATLSCSEKAMDRVPVLCCLDMSESDKRKLLVIGKRSKTWCFNGISMDILPVLYYANKNVWLTSEIFKKRLMSWEVELQWKLRNILLVLDNCAAYPHPDRLKNIFLSPSTISLVQPMDMVIIKNLKTLYHVKLVNYILEEIQENLRT